MDVLQLEIGALLSFLHERFRSSVSFPFLSAGEVLDVCHSFVNMHVVAIFPPVHNII